MAARRRAAKITKIEGFGLPGGLAASSGLGGFVGWLAFARIARLARLGQNGAILTKLLEALMNKLVAIAALGLIAGTAAGCQTPEQSSFQASNVCVAAGLHPGTAAYSRCYSANYANLRYNSQEAENAAVAGAALGVAGGALAGAAIANSGPYYYGGGWGPGWGYRPYGYGYGWGRPCGWGGCW